MVGRKRLLTKSKLDPKLLGTRQLVLPRWSRVLPEVMRQGGWDESITLEHQGDEKFRFDGRVFSLYCEKVFGRKTGKIYFPAAYFGKVAKALSDAGFDVLASDVSPYWVEHVRSMGLRAERRSIENIPSNGFDAVVSFEPYCADSTVMSYLALLRMLSQGLPYLEIVSDTFSDGNRSRLLKEARKRKLIETRTYPISYENMNRIAYDYGAGYRFHYMFSAGSLFCVHGLFPRPNAIRRASLDLAILESSEELPPRVDLHHLASRFRTTVERIAAAVSRLSHVLDERLDVGFSFKVEEGTGYGHFQRRLGLREAPEERNVGYFLRKIRIINGV